MGEKDKQRKSGTARDFVVDMLSSVSTALKIESQKRQEIWDYVRQNEPEIFQLIRSWPNKNDLAFRVAHALYREQYVEEMESVIRKLSSEKQAGKPPSGLSDDNLSRQQFIELVKNCRTKKDGKINFSEVAREWRKKYKQKKIEGRKVDDKQIKALCEKFGLR